MRLLTSLPAERLPADESAEAYHQRWGVETDLRFFKGPDHLPVVLSRKPETVRQEVLLRIMAHNWVRSVQAQACLMARAAGSGTFPPSDGNSADGPGCQSYRLRATRRARRRRASGAILYAPVCRAASRSACPALPALP